MAAMTAGEAAEAGKKLDFATIWAALLKTDEQLDKLSQKADLRLAEFNEQLKESRRAWEAESRRQMDELKRVVAETGRKVDKLSDNIGGIGNTLGKMVEAMFSMELWKKFNPYGFTFTRGVRYRFSIKDQILTEVDFFLENGDYAMAVEIKTDLSVEDVDEHLDRMVKVRRYIGEHEDLRKLVGAVAGTVVSRNVLRYAQRKGLFVPVQTGDSIAIAETPEGFRPREW